MSHCFYKPCKFAVYFFFIFLQHRTVNKSYFFSIVGLMLLFFCSCNKKFHEKAITVSTNNPEHLSKPYVILISLDGYRWDYTERFRPPNISKFIAEGMQAESLIPCFPSKTFPNHYSIATGMYPDHHGIVSNSFFNPDKNAIYKISDRDIVEDGTWYGGTPIWVQAAKAGMVTASYFFVGSEADVQGIRPTYYHRYDGSVPNETRVSQVIEWLNLPEEKRPHLITLYFSDMDDIGHRVGPNNDGPLEEKLKALDATLGNLFTKVEATQLPVNIIIVSDHGMMEVPVNQFMPIESIENDEVYKAVSNGAIVHIYLNKKKKIEAVYKELKEKGKGNHFEVYKTKDTPGFEIKPKNKSWGDIQVIPDPGWYFTRQRFMGFMKKTNKKARGEHGFDPRFKELHGIFYANGPAFKSGYITPSVKNIHIYPVICKILGLETPNEVDGKLEELEGVLK